MDKFNALKEKLAAVEADAQKFYDKGNQAAGTRVRVGMQEIKKMAQDIRVEVQDIKNK